MGAPSIRCNSATELLVINSPFSALILGFSGEVDFVDIQIGLRGTSHGDAIYYPVLGDKVNAKNLTSTARKLASISAATGASTVVDLG